MGKKKRSPDRVDDDEEEEEEETKDTTILTSLFAAANPFRRNPSIPNPPSNKKLKKEKATDPYISPPTQEEHEEGECKNNRKKKSKKHEKKSDEIEGEEKESPNGGDEDSKKKYKKQKRKRDEIEFQYEVRRYGQTPATEQEKGEEKGNPNGEDEGEKAIATVVGEKRKKVEGEKEKEGFDDEEKLLRTVFVGNLPFGTKRKALIRDFSSSFGDVESVRIRSVPIAPDTKAPRKAAVIKGKVNEAIGSVHAYVVFKEEESARAALAHNMVKFGGNHIRVDKACPPRKRMKGEAPIYSVKKTVFVGNLPFDVKDEELYQLFCEEHQMESSVEAVRVIRDPRTSLGKGIAYVMFKTREAANSVVKKRGIKLRDRELRVSHARTDSTPSSTPFKRKMENHGAVDYPSKHTSNNSGQADWKPKVTALSSSYQGLRSSKTGRPKRAPKVKQLGSTDSRRSKRSEGTVRQQKRPAVAARKANSQKLAQNKRKLDSHTPENPNGSKKARFF